MQVNIVADGKTWVHNIEYQKDIGNAHCTYIWQFIKWCYLLLITWIWNDTYKILKHSLKGIQLPKNWILCFHFETSGWSFLSNLLNTELEESLHLQPVLPLVFVLTHLNSWTWIPLINFNRLMFLFVIKTYIQVCFISMDGVLPSKNIPSKDEITFIKLHNNP